MKTLIHFLEPSKSKPAELHWHSDPYHYCDVSTGKVYSLGASSKFCLAKVISLAQESIGISFGNYFELVCNPEMANKHLSSSDMRNYLYHTSIRFDERMDSNKIHITHKDKVVGMLHVHNETNVPLYYWHAKPGWACFVSNGEVSYRGKLKEENKVSLARMIVSTFGSKGRHESANRELDIVFSTTTWTPMTKFKIEMKELLPTANVSWRKNVPEDVVLVYKKGTNSLLGRVKILEAQEQ